jgi:hypothetical protein
MSEYFHQLILADPRRGDGHDANGNQGDCWRTCIATVLGLHPLDVPNFVQQYSWMEAARLWLAPRGMDYGVTPGAEYVLDHPEIYDGRLLIATGPSPRGDWMHCVVVDHQLNLVHDPHPSGAGITSIAVVELIVGEWLFPRPHQLQLEAAS